jgi:hypothetical protein
MEPPPALDVVPDSALGLKAGQVLIQTSKVATAFWPAVGQALVFFILFVASVWLIFGAEWLGPAAFGMFFAFVWLLLVQPRASMRNLIRLWTAPPYLLRVDDEGVSATSDGGSFGRRWDRTTALIETDEFVCLGFDGLETLTIPAGCFNSREERDAWLAYVRDRVPATVRESLSR